MSASPVDREHPHSVRVSAKECRSPHEVRAENGVKFEVRVADALLADSTLTPCGFPQKNVEAHTKYGRKTG